MNSRAKLFKNGHSQAVRLPRAYRMSGTEVSIRREGNRIILEPLAKETWPAGFFRSIRIDDRHFRRPEQGSLPPAPSLEQ
jgi:virulence-associated protein VagC